jgi:cobalt-zinc-cadmium efflux system outer membrane protein
MSRGAPLSGLLPRVPCVLAALVGGVALAGTGCRRFEPAPLSPVDSASALEGRSLADPGLRALFERVLPGGPPRWPIDRWDLGRLTLAALYYHPSLEVARAQWRVAEAGIATAGARPNPTLSITPQYVANAAMGTPLWDITSALDWPIETAGKRGRRIDRAEQLATSARLSLDAAAWKVRANLRARLLDFVATRARVELLAREHDAQHEVVTLLEQRVQAGAASVAMVAPARLTELQTAADLAEAERQRREAQVRLATAVGVPVRAFDRIDVEFPLDGPSPDLDHLAPALRRRALQARSDILAALADYGASQSALQLEIARQYPDVRIGPGYEYDQGLNKWAVIGVSLELPVLNRNAGPIGEADARRTEAAARFTELQATVIDELDRALANRDASREALARSEAVLAAERERVSSTMRAFAAGAADRLALRTAEVEFIRAERIHLDAQVRLQQALGDLEAAVQPPLEVGSAVEQGSGPPGRVTP